MAAEMRRQRTCLNVRTHLRRQMNRRKGVRRLEISERALKRSEDGRPFGFGGSASFQRERVRLNLRNDIFSDLAQTH